MFFHRPYSAIGRFLAFVAWAAFFFLMAAKAAPVPAPLPGYFTHLWQTEDGLPQNSVPAIAQTRDGYLWLATYSGLVRFDGVRFTVFDTSNTPELQSSRVTSLLAEESGELWVGHETGELVRFANGRFTAVATPTVVKGKKIVAIYADELREIWLATEEGLLARIRDGLALTAPAGNAPGQFAVCRDTGGKIWIAREGKISALTKGKLVPVDLPVDSDGGYVQGICAGRAGGIWVASDRRLRKWQNNRWTEDLGDAPWAFRHVTPLIEMRNGLLAAGTVDDGLYLVAPDKRVLHFDLINGLPQNWVRSLCEDHEGNLWVGAGSSGLVALHPAKVTPINPPDQWQGRAVLSVTTNRDGSMSVATEGAGIYHYANDSWTRFGEGDGLANQFVWSLGNDPLGRLWAGTWGGGIFWQKTNAFERVSALEDITSPAPAILHAAHGVTWIGTGDGLLRCEESNIKRFGRAEGLELPDVRTIAQAPDGTIWFGMSGGGLGRFKDDRLQQFRKHDGLASDFLQCLRVDPDGALWIGTSGGGLSRFKNGRFATVGPANGLPNNVICAIEEDDRGFFWMSSHHGILRVAKSELNRCADGEISVVHCADYGKGEGMPTLECSGGFQPASAKTADGRLWFPTSKGLVVVNPAAVKSNPLPPPVIIEDFLVDNRRPPDLLRIQPGSQQFEFRYTALSFTAPERVRFRYRLEGLESEWTDAGAKRAISFSHLPPDHYIFHVTACNNDGVWNEKGAHLALTVLPHFWQTWWFRGASIAFSAAAVAGLVQFDTRRRMRARMERLEQQRAVERERARIAKDIHDDLGASLTRITMLSQTVRGELTHAPEAAADVDRIYGTARELTRALDEIVWAVNPQHDTLDSLGTYLGKFAQDFLSAAQIRCRLDVPLRLPAWPLSAEVRHNLYLAFKEALNNVVKHAAAPEVRIALKVELHSFALIVEDKGRGFTPKSAPSADRFSSGNGLNNMRQRLSEIGGQFKISSTPGGGTIVIFSIPIKFPNA